MWEAGRTPVAEHKMLRHGSHWNRKFRPFNLIGIPTVNAEYSPHRMM